MGVKLSKLMMRQYKDGVYRMSRVTVAKHVAQLEDKIATLRAELMSLKGAYYSANNKGWQLEFDNAAFRRFCSMVRESIEGGRVVTFQDVDIEELDALLAEESE